MVAEDVAGTKGRLKLLGRGQLFREMNIHLPGKLSEEEQLHILSLLNQQRNKHGPQLIAIVVLIAFTILGVLGGITMIVLATVLPNGPKFGIFAPFLIALIAGLGLRQYFASRAGRLGQALRRQCSSLNGEYAARELYFTSSLLIARGSCLLQVFVKSGTLPSEVLQIPPPRKEDVLLPTYLSPTSMDSFMIVPENMPTPPKYYSENTGMSSSTVGEESEDESKPKKSDS